MKRCAECRRAKGRYETVSGRLLCKACYRRLAEFSGAGSGMVSGASPGRSVGIGIATGRWAGAVEAEGEAMRKRREKLDATTGFWRRLWVRIWG